MLIFSVVRILVCIPPKRCNADAAWIYWLYTVLPLVFLLCHWLASRVVGVVRRMTID
jgi:hypothetical protein